MHTAEDTTVTIGVLANDSDQDGTLQPATIAVVQPPTKGSVVSQPNGTFVYTPQLNFAGTDSFTYTVADDDGAVSTQATVVLWIDEVNDAPLARNDDVATRVGEPILIDVLVDNGFGPDRDIDGTLLAATTTVVDGPSDGVLYNNGNGSLLYRPAQAFVGTVYFSYTIQDDRSASSEPATVTIHIGNANLAPVARDDDVQTEEDTPLTVNVLPDSGSGADYDPDGTLVASTTVAVSGPSHGTLTNRGDGSFTYTPALDFSGTDDFTYSIQDDDGRRATRPVSRSPSRKSTTPPWRETII